MIGDVSLEVPLNVVIELIGSNVQISWDKVAGANSYKIFAADTPDGTFTDVTSEGTFGEPVRLTRNRQYWFYDWGNLLKQFYKVTASSERQYFSRVIRMNN